MPAGLKATFATLRLHRRFRSRAMGTSRDVIVWLPPGYESAKGPDGRPNRRRHPVVYFQDGQNIFDPLTAFLGQAWHAGGRALDLLETGAITAPIMVGIYNRGFDRMNEYAPTAAEFSGWDGEKCRSTGDAKRYVKFVADELKPFIDAKYRTFKGPRHNSVVGSSMGGLVALYYALWQPRVFGRVAALSPSLWWDERRVIRDFDQLKRKTPVRVWLDMGTAEPGWEVVRAMRDTLVARGWKPGRDLAYREVEGGVHTEHAWAARIGDVLRWILGR